ncbi:MAG: decaprenyl-phosphate phosphoribosyltransferase [Acidobacteria bacterium]|nr:decaprenyl-phosphate phosphoribosyltransferase [Acidobacteriota bacterium]
MARSPLIQVPRPFHQPAIGTARRSQGRALVVSLRPEQWTKNLLVFAGLIFGGRLLEPAAILAAFSTFVVFCALSGGIYLVNDLRDREGDQKHPIKRQRPIAAGELPASTALLAAIVLIAGGVGGAALVTSALAGVASAYAALLLLYSLALKHFVILDVMTISAGFVLRAVAGAVAVMVPISSWLLVCATLLALFLALSKRRHELVLLGGGAEEHRPILDEYSPYLLDQMISVVTASTVMGYTVYATSPDTAARLGTSRLGLTVPFVLYGIFRYLYLVHQKKGGGSPSTLLLSDRPLLLCVGMWIGTAAVLMYSPLGH